MLGNDLPLRLSPQHRVLVGQGANQGLLPVKALIGQRGVQAAAGPGIVIWHHLALARHQVLFAAGAAVESLYPGPQAAQMLGAQLPALQALLPGFGTGGALWPPARPLLRPGQWRRQRLRAA